MEKCITLLKILTSIILNGIILSCIVIDISMLCENFVLSFFLLSIIVNIILVTLMYFIHQAIWTEGKAKKIILGIFFIIIWAFMTIISLGPN